ncbi:hypothetical protein L6452_29500 [Arctium lappa]|uniref:Uncharacterized protein n=1 Tax=Arctium lappa TaxID=4217 RepID=A0ACB8ZL78_ARCLA|nr:hypothetical protein L6452_29500 [Arctium lappa]
MVDSTEGLIRPDWCSTEGLIRLDWCSTEGLIRPDGPSTGVALVKKKETEVSISGGLPGFLERRVLSLEVFGID